MTMPLSRRDLLASIGIAAGATLLSDTRASAAPTSNSDVTQPFRYCLNTSTIRGPNLGIVQKCEIAAKAGYHAVEPWIREIEEYRQAGGALTDLARHISDLGLTVESAIGFAPWIVDDDAARAKGLEQARREMDLVRQIGGTRIAAPPAGATDQSGLNLLAAAKRYRALCDIGDQIGVVPQVEVWGFSKSVSRLGEAALIAVESGHQHACLLPDVYHLYKGGSDIAGLKLLAGSSIHVFHFNDYPADPPRDRITDAERIFPGDGVAPLDALLRTLRDIGCRGCLSLELFNRGYWQQDALTIARGGVERMRKVVERALG